MSQRITTQMQDLWSKVETARAQWNGYLASTSPELFYTLKPELVLESPAGRSITHRIGRINLTTRSLNLRLGVIRNLKATAAETVGGSGEELISERLPDRLVGPETASSALTLAVNRTEVYLARAEASISMSELMITDRFDELRKNYDTILKGVASVASPLSLAIAVNAFAARASGVIQDADDDEEDLGGIADHLREGQQKLDAFIAIIERQVLKFKENMTMVGVMVPRQRLITEFLEQ
ncbi:hypothetical protein LTR37_006099 [Vermiconidia calcicola]|uniref:Uncharacterized protein n=1 Tax=Vermiconidia calcicola TaxID=1690605 RepID=A0ACC3NHU9_9PEZI|nr:hypothetical protein LTR37_006099 [Vermiconidia calcicola]